MKKIVAVVLSVLLISGIFGILAYADRDELRFLVTSDVHWHRAESIDSDGFFRPRDSLGQMTSLTPLIVDEFLKQAAESDAEYLLISGDLTNYSNIDEARTFAGILSEFEDTTGKSVFVALGNHDIRGQDFKDVYYRFGFEEAVAVDEKSASYAADLSDKYRLISIDSMENEDSSEGYISGELLAWIETQVNAAKDENKNVIAMMHHHLMEHITLESTIDDFYIIHNHEDICKKFEEMGIRLTFTGHMHMSDVAEYKGRTTTIYDATTAALSCYPLTYRDVSITGGKISMSAPGITSLDISNIPAGYSDEQKEMIANEPVRYAYGCQQDSFINEYVANFVDADYLIDMLGVESDSLVAKAIYKILPNVLIPLYGEGNTVESRAKELGYNLTESDYETVEDLLTAFWAALVRGDEDLGGNSTEGKLFLESVYALLVSKLSEESGFVKTVINNKIIGKLGLKGIDNIFTRSALDKILIGFFVDKSPADNDLTLPGYDTDGATTIFQKIIAFFRGLLEKIRQIFGFGA